jgi:hypothetical protein
MAHGLAIYNAQGVAFFSTESITWNFIGSFIAPANSAASAVFPSLSLMTEVLIQRQFIDAVPDNQAAYIHTAIRTGTTVSASGGVVQTLITVLGR